MYLYCTPAYRFNHAFEGERTALHAGTSAHATRKRHFLRRPADAALRVMQLNELSFDLQTAVALGYWR